MSTKTCTPTVRRQRTVQRLALLAGLLWVALAVSPAHARDWYIATDGVDAAGRGSIDQPLHTLGWLLAPYGHTGAYIPDARPGDIVSFRAGTYPMAQVRIEIGNLTLRAYDPVNEPVRFTASTEESVAYVIQFSPGGSGGRLQGIEIVGGGYYAVKFEGEWDYAAIPFAQRYKLGNITVENCRIHDTGRDAIKITPGVSDITIRGCEIYNTGIRDNSNSDGVDCVNGTRILVQDCYIHDTATQGLYFKGGSRDCVVERTRFENTSGAGVILGFYTDLDWFDTDVNPDCYENVRGIVRNCVIRNAGGMGIAFYGAYQAKAYNNTLINVNATNHNSGAIVFCPGTIYGSTDAVYPPNVDPVLVNNIIVVSPDCTTPTVQVRVVDGHSGLTGTPTIRNNRWHRASGALTFQDQRTGFSGNFALWAAHIGETGSSVGDPGLDASGHLLAGSPCIDTGDSTAPVAVDFDGQPRTAPFEIGADEIAATPLTTYAAWRVANFTGSDLAADAVSGPLADPDGAGLTNLARYAFALPARGPVEPPVVLGTTGTSTARHLSLTFNTHTAATDLSYLVEASSDLVTWATLATYAPAATNPVVAEDTVPLSDPDTTRRFLRLRLVAP